MPGSSLAVTAASCPVWLPWGLCGLPRLRTPAGIAQFSSFFSGEGGPGSWEEFQALSHPEPGWDFTRAQTLGAPSTCGVPWKSGPPPDPGWELTPPGNSGPGATWLQHVCLLAGGQAQQPQLSPAQPSALHPVIAVPQGQSDPSSARSGHCTCVPTPCQGCSTAMGTGCSF